MPLEWLRRCSTTGRFLPAVALVMTVAVLPACAPAVVPAGPGRAGNEAFLDDLERRTFDFFWETTNPENGLAPDRWPSKSFSSVAAIGFALTAYPIGVERGWITRQQAADRTLTTLRFLWRAPQGPQPTGVTGYKGFFYHFLDMQTGLRFEQVELSTIDTSLLLAGVLTCEMYFDGDTDAELAIRALSDSLYRRVEWPWAQARPPYVSMGWHPETGFIRADWRGYNEAMLLYVLALGSPTHPIDPAAWEAWTSTYRWEEFHGYEHVNFAPLFGHQYSHVWIDFRGIQDAYMRSKGIDYFENSRRATLSQRNYAIANPGGWRGYSGDIWGLTASDGPKDTTITIDGRRRRFHSYWARGAAGDEINDDGTIVPTATGGAIPFAPDETIVPTATGGAIPFAPDETIAALRAMRERYGDELYQRYGFLDAFNPTFTFGGRLQHGRVVPGVGWFDTDYLGIDQGPIVAMIENHRTGMIWDLFRRHPAIVRGLRRAGFGGGWLDRTAQ